MRAYILFAVAALSMFPMPVSAQTSEKTLAAEFKEAYRKAKTEKEITSITHACRLEVTGVHSDEVRRLLDQAGKLAESKVSEATALLKKAQALKDDEQAIGNRICKP